MTVPELTVDEELIMEFLDAAANSKGDDYSEGYWVGRALQHADQNAISFQWLVAEFSYRELELAKVQGA